jgi:cilia- and flagella-associated protein 52
MHVSVHGLTLAALVGGTNCTQDEYAYIGTSTGDLLQVGLANKLFNNLGPKGNKGKREMFSQGILCSCITPFGDLLMGCGDGTLLLCDRNLKIITTAKVSPKVRTLSPAHQ